MLTNDEMTKYFSKYTKWHDFFIAYEPYHTSGFYVIQNDEIKNFFLNKYYKRLIEEQLGKINFL